MDRRRALTALLIGVGGAQLAASGPIPIKEAQWIAAPNRHGFLSGRPESCVRGTDTTPKLLTGAAAFRAPLLLGGQAARAGISCASCHRNGRGNSAFLFPGLSGTPGTADITSSLMSKKRGDGIFNPVPIPDLTFDKPKISRAADGDDLRKFIHGLIVEEFDGAEPPARILEGLVAYVRALDPEGCSKRDAPLTLRDHIADISAALNAAANARREGDRESAALLVGSARSTLGLVFERYQGSDLSSERAAIAAYDVALAAQQRSATEVADIDPAKRLAVLKRNEQRSLYNSRKLARAVQR